MINFLEASITELFLLVRKMLIQATERKPWLLKFIAGPYKTQEMCENAVEGVSWTLEFNPNQ